MDSFRQDVRYGLRVLMKTPAVTGVAILTLALGIGANTAIFSLADAFLWSRLPVKDPEQLVFVYARLPGGRTEWSFPYSTFEGFRDSNHSLSGLFAYDDSHVAVTIDGQPEYVDADFVSGSYFDVLGVGAACGRTFVADDDQPGRPVVAVISDRYWQRRFARDPAAVGRTIYAGKVPVTVVGVTPPGFFGRKAAGSYADVVLPMFIHPRLALKDHDRFGVMARLKTGTSAAQAREDLDLIYRRALMATAGAALSPQAAREIGQRAIQLAPGVRGTTGEGTDLGTQLPILLAVAGIVLLIACVNVANLQLARATARQREIAVRLSIGAGRGRLIRQLMTESAILAILGGTLGLLLAGWSVELLTAVLSRTSPIVFSFGVNERLLAFTAAVSLLTGVLFGLVPALSATRVDLSPMFTGGAERSTSGPWRRRMAQWLVVSQMALSLALLVGAGLLIRTLQRLYSVDPGFEREKILLTWVMPALNGYDQARESALYRELLVRMNAIPGVQSATLSRYRLVIGRPYRDVWVRDAVPAFSEGRRVYCGVVGPRFFETMGIGVLQGREFSVADDAAAPRVAIISESVARTAFPGGNALGQRIGFAGPPTAADALVIGVVRDLNRRLVEPRPEEAVYIPVGQAPPDSLGQMNLVLRTTANSASIGAALRSAVGSIDKDLTVEGLQTQAQEVDEYLGGRRSLAEALGFFGALALLLAAIGLYGTMSHAVGRRTREIGIRLALGAQRTDMLWMVLREASLQVVAGIAVGALIARAAARLIASILFGVGVADPPTFAAAILVMTATALAASYLPARRATRIDPAVSLRYE
jgi:predicted permease